MENISRVPFGLDLAQPGIVPTEGSHYVTRVVLIEIINIARLCTEGLQRSKALACPRYVLAIGCGILPLKNEHEIVAFATKHKRRLVLRDASGRPMPVLQGNAAIFRRTMLNGLNHCVNKVVVQDI